jgi:hypothetical protein
MFLPVQKTPIEKIKKNANGGRKVEKIKFEVTTGLISR